MNLKISKQVIDLLNLALSGEWDNSTIKIGIGSYTTETHFCIIQEPSGGYLLFSPHPTLRDCKTNGALLDPDVFYTLLENKPKQMKGE